MAKFKHDQRGSHLVAILLFIALAGIIGFTAIRVISQNNNKPQSQANSAGTTEKQQTSASPITWQFNEQAEAWQASAKPPDCVDPFKFDVSPVDINRATSVLYPGQTRGGHYKAHGGFAFDAQSHNNVTVTMPFDAYLVGGSRYIESGEVQYLFDFVSECGIAIRFDHLASLSEKFAGFANQYLPEPKPDDSRGANISPPILIKSGEVIATAIGHSNNLNVGMDFGVYDYRSRNEASKDSTYQAAHGQFSASTYYGVCWFDMLPGNDAAQVKSLPSRDQAMGKTSDYCK